MYYVGIDIGGTFTKIALICKTGKILTKITFRTTSYPKKQLIKKIIASVKEILSKKKLNTRQVKGIGIGLPGLIDSKRGVVRYLVNIPGWRKVPLKRIFEKALKIRTFIDNDVNVMTLGELYYGAGKGAKNIICITLGTGVGGGIVINGRLYRGPDLVAGEIGHIPINEHGPKCNCGGNACIESYVGNRYLMKKLSREGRGKISFQLLDKQARKGKRRAVGFWRYVGEKLGIMLVGVVNFLNPEKIIIGGGIANAGRYLFNPLKKTIAKRAMRVQRKRVKIVKAKLGGNAGVIGAAVLVKEGRS